MRDSRHFEFTWPVHASGYAWGSPRPGSYLPEDEGWHRQLAPVEADGPVRRYEPLREHPALFRTFADLDLGQEVDGFVRFANQYGLLGRPPAGYRLEVEGLQVGDGLLDTWDLHRAWWAATLAMRDAIFLGDLIRAGDRAQLKEHVRWEGTDRVVYDPRTNLPRSAFRVPFMELGVAVIASRQQRPDWLGHFTPGDVVTPALSHLTANVNKWLCGLTDARLYLNDSDSRPKSRLVPNSLLGALWLQFHLSIANGTEYRQCDICRSWFEISPRVNRATKVHCGDGCRSQAFRDRKKRAVQLHEGGKSVAEIAKELGSDVPTVRKWVREREE